MPNSNRITKDWLDIADANLSKKLQPLANAKVVRVLDTAPSTTQEWEALTSYTIDGVTYAFKPGDEVRVPDNGSETGYTYYKLDAIVSGAAKWALSESDVTSRVKITVNLDAYVSTDGNTYTKTLGTELAGVVVTLTENSEGTSVSKTVASGETSVIFKGVAPLLNYTLSVSAIDGYSQPANQTITNPQMGDELTKTFAYYADEYTFTATSNQDTQSTPDETIAAVKATVTYGGESYQKIGTVKFPKDTVLTSVTWPDVTGYSKTSSNTGFAYSAEYSTEVCVVNVSALNSQEETVAADGATVSINGIDYVLQDGTQGATKSGNIWTVTTKIPYNTTYSIAATGLTGYDDPTTISNITSNQITRTTNLQFTARIENGVYAYYSDGSIKPYASATSDAIGVAVIDDDACFVIDKSSDEVSAKFGGYNYTIYTIVNTNNSTIACADFDGYRNTTNIISTLNGYTDSQSVTGAPAAEWCRSRFNGNGYLAALGEWNTAYKYKTDINAMMAAISGDILNKGAYWTSTSRNDSSYSWYFGWNGGSNSYTFRYNANYVRPFCTINTSLTLTLVSSDSSTVSGLTVTVTDRTGVSQTLVTDSTGKVTFSNVACGTVNVSIAGRGILNGGDTFTVNMNMSARNVTLNTVINGTFAYYSDGTYDNGEKHQAGSDTAIGVAVIDTEACFVIDKTNVSGTKKYGGYNRDLSMWNIVTTTDSTIAKTDFDGYRNTTKIISACAGYTAQSITGAPAAEACRTRFSGEGYLPAIGEWDVAYKYKTDINAMLTDKIGGTAISSSYNWSSTLYSSASNSWELDWGASTIGGYSRIYGLSTRAFRTLNTPIFLTLTSSDSTTVNNITVNVTDKTGNLQSVTTDSNGQVTVNNVACGDVFVSVPGKQTTNSTFNVTPFSTSFTVGVTTPSTGVYAYYSDGTMKTQSEADSNAIGVAVITSNCAFVIDKTDIKAPNSQTTVTYGGYQKDLTGTAMITTDSTTAKTDFNGQQNSANIATACSGYNDGYRTGSAAEDCQSRFNGKGYFGSVGEWWDAYQNKTAVNNMMTAIGGTALFEGYYWTSTLYNTSTNSWALSWHGGGVIYDGRNLTSSVRAFSPL